MNYRYIDTQDTFNELADQLRNTKWLGLDTEFVREKTYWPQLCLLQISTAGELVLIDPLAVEDLSPLHGLLHDSKCCCVLHAPDQDLEVLYHVGVPRLNALFDTQSAAALLGYPEQIGYAQLVETLLGITLDKTQQRTDWSRRPLHDQQLRYAAADVLHLSTLHEALENDLEAKGRLQWLHEDCNRLTEPDRYRTDPALAWRKLRGINRLSSEQQAAAMALAAWRERTAISADRPRRWILQDDLLYRLARQQPANMAELASTGLGARQQRKHGAVLLETLQSTRDKHADLPAPPDGAQRKRAKELAALVGKVAEQEQLAASLLATRSELESLVAGNAPDRLVNGWRRDVIGETLLQKLR